MKRRRLLVHGISLLSLSVSGCLSSNQASSTQDTDNTSTVTSRTMSPRTVSLEEQPAFPDGPKEKPSIPDVWNESSSRVYAKEYEKRRLYNEYYTENTEELTIMCDVTGVENSQNGYKVTLYCQGVQYMEGTTHHGDYIGPKVTYYLTSKSVKREQENPMD